MNMLMYSIYLILNTILFVNIFSCRFTGSSNNYNQPASGFRTAQYHVEAFTENLMIPWSIVFTGENRILVNERPGRMRVIENGKLIDSPIKNFDDVYAVGEAGLMGLTLDPDYSLNKLIYVSYAYRNNGNPKTKIVRFKDEGNSLSDELTIFDNIPAARFHNGCRIKFGPDKKLYITTGDATDRDLSQDVNKLNGKILRINSDGTMPEDNPFPNSPVWSYGNRNAQGLDWYPGTDILFETEHGPSGFDGPGGGDEVNIIYTGKNYGWPVVHHKLHQDGMEDPLLEFTPAVAPASGMFYRSGVISEFKNNFFFGCLVGECIIRVVVDKNDPTKVVSFEKMKDINYGRIRDIVEGPDGSIYFGTSNRDGRGEVRTGDDKIYRIVKN